MADGEVRKRVFISHSSADKPLMIPLAEALRLPDGRLVATQPATVFWRRPRNVPEADWRTLPGPLKVLVAVGAPDEEFTAAAVLDQERELQCILDAIEPAQRLENVEVRILEVGHPKSIAQAVRRHFCVELSNCFDN